MTSDVSKIGISNRRTGPATTDRGRENSPGGNVSRISWAIATWSLPARSQRLSAVAVNVTRGSRCRDARSPACRQTVRNCRSRARERVSIRGFSWGGSKNITRREAG